MSHPMLAVATKDRYPQYDGDPTTAVEHMANTEGGWLFDVKWDGVRCIAHVNGGAVTLRNRNDRIINDRYPDVCKVLSEAFPTGSITLDGEIIVFNEEGKPDFGLVSRRDRVGSLAKAVQAAERLPATYVVFDLLEEGHTSFLDTAYGGRRALLAHHVQARPGLTVSPASPDGQTMWSFVQQQGLEGLIAKRFESTYRAGRSTAWVKLKDTKRVSCIVTGMEEGTGKAAGMMGKLHLALYDDQGELVTVGKVGTGFKDADRKRWWANPQWAKGYSVVEVEYANVTPDGILRFPSFKGHRDDLDVSDCNLDQIT